MKPDQSECVAILTKSPQPEKPTLLIAEIVEELLILHRWGSGGLVDHRTGGRLY